MTSPVRTPAPDVPLLPPFASADDLLVFNLTAILHAWWFLGRSHLASNVVSAQRSPSGDINWVKFTPPFHSHLIKCATALLPPQLCSMKQLKGVLFAYVLEVLNSPVSTLAQFKRKTLSKKVCPRLDPAFKPPPPAGRHAATPVVCSRLSPAAPSPAPVSPVLAVGSVAMACDTPPPSLPLPLPRAQGSATPAPPAPCAWDLSHLSPKFLAGFFASQPTPLPQAPSKCPASPLSPPQWPMPHARGIQGFLPSCLLCSCHTAGWASCRVHLTWDSSPLWLLPHALSTSSPPFIFLTMLLPALKEQVLSCDDCSWDPPDAPDCRLHLCRIHFSAFASDPRPIPPGAA